MRTLLVSALALGLTASVSLAAEPSRTMLTDDQMDSITAGQTVTVSITAGQAVVVTVSNTQTNPQCRANCNNVKRQVFVVVNGRYSKANATAGNNTNTQRLTIYKYNKRDGKYNKRDGKYKKRHGKK